MSNLSAEDLKAKGNECFKEKRYHKAIAYYSQSLEQNLDSVVLSNRCQAYLSLKYYEAALTDASESIRLNPDFVKSYWRRALALTNLGIHSKARVDLKHVLEIDPDNKAAQELLLKIFITYDKPIVPIEIYDKNPYVRSTKPLVRIPISEKDTDFDSGVSTTPSEALMPSQNDNDFSSTASTDDEPLPPPATTPAEFYVAWTSLKDNPTKFLEYFLTIPTSSFTEVFEPGVEPDSVETLLTAFANDYTGNEQILYSLEKLTKAPRFEVCTIFLTDKMKMDLKNALLKFSDYSSLVYEILDAFNVEN
uniref:RNA-polymerase II-associated protein 3-like C-terminal domain-containing protein n=1 Tax=Panagrolaimus sp. ES5 TaxID=591445 RepID=A0AC34GQF6_9BILA